MHLRCHVTVCHATLPQKEQREAAKRRGNPDFYTSDAKFDERFALGYGIIGGDKVGRWGGAAMCRVRAVRGTLGHPLAGAPYVWV